MAKNFPARYAESTLKRMYGKLNANEKTVGLLHDYFNAMANLYGIIPIKKVCEIITEQNKDIISEQLVLDFAEIVRHEEHFYSVLGMEELYSNAEKSLPIDRELIAQNIALFDFEYYYDLSEMQQNKPYYIPSKSKLLKYADSDYYDKTLQTAALTKFIRSDMSGYPELTFEDIFYEIYIFAQMESDNPADTIIEDYVWDRIKDEIIGEAGGWGLVKIGYMPPENNKKNGRFTLLDYKNFCPYDVKLEPYREARKNFTTEEWMDILLGAIDYNADGFVREDFLDIDVWTAKHTMLTRLLPFIQSNLNLIELAPQQTGKSYIFGKLCKYGWLAGGGSISRAKLFLDMRPGAKSAGLVTFNDFVAIDEIKSIKFTNDKEIAGILKGYMEDGRVKVGDVNVEGEAGIIFLGNISIEDMDGMHDMFRELPEVFRDTALIQRIHGFVPGRNIPPLSKKMFINDWALNTEYFTEIMHKMRTPAESMRYRGLVEELVSVSSKKDDTSGREQEAIMRMCTAYLKLFFPHVDENLIHELSFRKDFRKYCLEPAIRMQDTVLQQMKIINPGEFGNRSLSTYKLRDDF